MREIKIGERILTLEVKITREMLLNYCRIIKEVNPIHFDEKYARSLGFKDIVVQGVFTFGFMTKMLTDWTGDPTRLKSLEIRFQSPVYADDIVVFSGIIKRIFEQHGEQLIECEVWAEKKDGERVMEGVAVVSMERS